MASQWCNQWCNQSWWLHHHHQFNKVQLSLPLETITTITEDHTAHSVELTPNNSQERKSVALPFCGVCASCGPPVSCAAFHAAWTDARIPNWFAQNANKSNKQFQQTAADRHSSLNDFFRNFILKTIFSFMKPS